LSTKSSPKPVARQTIARSARSGWLIGERQGREVRWQLSAAAKRLIEEGIGRVYSLHNRSEQWEGNWLILLVTVPNSHRDVRKRLYSALDWAGFGNPSAGVWLNPYPEREAEFRRIVHEVRLGEWMLCFRASALPFGLSLEQIVQRGWGDLDTVAAIYQTVLERYSDARPMDGGPILCAQLEMVSQWQRMPFVDPQLPDELLPDWIGRHAAGVIRERRAEWHEAAQPRWREVVETTSPSRV
jgi:phenylacetic acid degradation operon negative regulatory protein